MKDNIPTVLHLAKWYPHHEDPQNGVFVEQQVRICSEIANQAVLYWGSGSVQFDEFAVENGIPTLRSYFTPGKKVANAKLKWQSVSKLIDKAFDGRTPDLIHLHIADNDQLLILQYAKLKGIPVILTEHWSGYLDGRFEAKGTIGKTLSTSLIKRVDVCTAVSGFLADAIIEKTGRTHVEIVPNSVFVEGLIPDRSTLEPEHFAVLADLDDSIKNISGVLRAFRTFHQNHANAHLSIVGDGVDRPKLEKLASQLEIEEAVTFHGRFPHKDSLSRLEKASTIIINSHRETFSVVALEAIALGKKLICTKCGGPETFLMDDVVTWVTPNDDIQLFEAMELSLNQPAPTQELVQKQLEPFEPEQVAKQWKDIYKGLL